MNKEKLLEIFEELLEEYESEWNAAESQFGVGDTDDVGRETVAEYRRRFTEVLKGEHKTEVSEISRIENVELIGCYDTNCVSCKKEIKLWYNGGELDTRYCCGYTYELESPQIDFVITKGEEAPL